MREQKQASYLYLQLQFAEKHQKNEAAQGLVLRGPMELRAV